MTVEPKPGPAGWESPVSAPTGTSDSPGSSLITGPFMILAAATLAFYIAGGIILPITPRFVEERLAGDTLAVGIIFASYAIASLASARSSAGRQTDSAAGRCSSAALCSPWPGWSSTLSPST